MQIANEKILQCIGFKRVHGASSTLKAFTDESIGSWHLRYGNKLKREEYYAR